MLKFEENRVEAAAAKRVAEVNKENQRKINQLNIVHVFAKIKGIAVRNRVRILDFLKNYDKHNELCILETDFRRGLNLAGVRLEHMELNLICEMLVFKNLSTLRQTYLVKMYTKKSDFVRFRSPLRKNYVDYKRFCDSIEEVFHQPLLERAPLIVPLQHIPSYDDSNNFLNFDERQMISGALNKLAKYPDQVSNLSSIFEVLLIHFAIYSILKSLYLQDFDRCKIGTVTQNQFLRALTTRSIHDVISPREFNVICKCFGIEKGNQFLIMLVYKKNN